MSDDFQTLQREFTASIRRPDLPRPKHLAPERLAIYQELTFYNFDAMLSGALPILRSVLTDNEWQSCLREFVLHHGAQTPLFYEIPQEFVSFLSQRSSDPRWWFELAHFEWVDLALDFAAENLDALVVNRTSNVAENIPVLSPLAWLLHYHYPVHHISPQNLPMQSSTENYYYIAFRNRALEVRFLPITIFTARLFELLTNNTTQTGYALIQEIIKESQHPNPDVVLKGGLDSLQDLLQRDIIIGCQI